MNKLMLYSRFAYHHFTLAYIHNKTMSDVVPKSDPNYPKYVHYSGHSENLAYILEALGKHNAVRVPPSSCLLFEYYMENN